MFDSEEDAERLRPTLRSLFERKRFEVLVIPGNHDRNAFAANLDFGRNLRVARGPFEVIEKRNISITAVPFTDAPADDLLPNLKKKGAGKPSFLLLHCTLDIGFSPKDFGDEEGSSYFPITATTLSNLGYDYVLAGHFHKSTRIQPLENGGLFIYPGSPVSHTSKECGQRQVVLIDAEKHECAGIPLNTFFYDRVEISFLPGEEDKRLAELQKWAKERAEQDCQMTIVTKGFIKVDERDFSEKLSRLGDQIDIENKCRNVSEVLEHPLFRRFKQKLEAREDIANKEAVECRVIEAMALLLAGQELSGRCG